MIEISNFEKVKSFLTIAGCVELSPDVSRYSIGCGIDIIVEINSVISFVDYRFATDGQIISIGQASTEQMQELSAITAPKMLQKINELMISLPV